VPDQSEAVPLADFIDALRGELRTAREHADPELPIEIGPVTVEFTVLTRREGEGRAGLRFWVVDAGFGGKKASESTQKVTMQLAPLGPQGRPARVRDVD
jgi:hypothetical protein